MSDPFENGTGLRALVAGPPVLVAPGIYDALTALLASRAGFKALYLSGASIAYTRFGRPDLGLVGMDEVAETLMAIKERVAAPIIVDARRADSYEQLPLTIRGSVRLAPEDLTGSLTGLDLDKARPVVAYCT